MLLGSPSSRLSRPPPSRRARRAGPCTRYAAISAAAAAAAASDPRRARAGGNEQSLFLATDADTARWSRSVQYSFVPPRGRTAPPRLNHRRVVIIADRAGDRRMRFIPSHVPWTRSARSPSVRRMHAAGLLLTLTMTKPKRGGGPCRRRRTGSPPVGIPDCSVGR